MGQAAFAVSERTCDATNIHQPLLRSTAGVQSALQRCAWPCDHQLLHNKHAGSTSSNLTAIHWTGRWSSTSNAQHHGNRSGDTRREGTMGSRMAGPSRARDLVRGAAHHAPSITVLPASVIARFCRLRFPTVKAFHLPPSTCVLPLICWEGRCTSQCDVEGYPWLTYTVLRD